MSLEAITQSQFKLAIQNDHRNPSVESECLVTADNLISVCISLGDVLFVRGFEINDTQQQVEEFIGLLPEHAVVLLTMAASSIQTSSFFANNTDLVTDLGGSTEKGLPQWYCLIGFHGLETFPWITEQRSVHGEPCEISNVIKIPSTYWNIRKLATKRPQLGRIEMMVGGTPVTFSWW